MVCSNEQKLNKGIGNLQNVFHHTNVYPKVVIQNAISKVKDEQSAPCVNITESQ